MGISSNNSKKNEVVLELVKQNLDRNTRRTLHGQEYADGDELVVHIS